MTCLHHSQGMNRGQVSLNFVNERRNVRVPDADFVVEPCTKEKDHGLVEGYAEDSSRMLTIGPFLLGVDGVPEEQLAVHSS